MKCKKLDFIKNRELIPPEKGHFQWIDHSGKVLYADMTSQLQRNIYQLFHESKKDDEILKIASRTVWIEYQLTENWLEALLELKFNQTKFQFETPNHYKNYAYLGIDFFHVPFFQVMDNTTSDHFFLGPFQHRFFIYDFLEVMADAFQYPFCEHKQYPCERYAEKLCSGLCLQDRSVFQALAYRYYLQKNQTILTKLQDRKEHFRQKLDFQKADTVDQQIKIIQKFYRYLTFFHVTKQLELDFSYKDFTVRLQKGQIWHLRKGSEQFEFPISEPEYKNNELFAIDKSILNESWILFQHCEKNFPNEIEKEYLKSVQHLTN